MGSLDTSQNQNGIWIRFSSQNSGQKLFYRIASQRPRQAAEGAAHQPGVLAAHGLHPAHLPGAERAAEGGRLRQGLAHPEPGVHEEPGPAPVLVPDLCKITF